MITRTYHFVVISGIIAAASASLETKAQAKIVHINYCSAFCGPQPVSHNANAATTSSQSIFQKLQQECPEGLSSTPGHTETCPYHSGSVTTWGWGYIKTREIYNSAECYVPGQPTSSDKSCAEQWIDTDVPQTHIGGTDLQG